RNERGKQDCCHEWSHRVLHAGVMPGCRQSGPYPGGRSRLAAMKTNSPKSAKTATLYRMVMPDHVCPYGLKARHLLRSQGYQVDDRWLTNRAETDAFKAEHGVKTTPQTFIDGARIGGHDDLRRHFGKP